MDKIYACLAGNWLCLNDDPDCVISSGANKLSPCQWYKENMHIYGPFKQEPNAYKLLEYVEILYLGKKYLICPIFIQIISE